MHTLEQLNSGALAGAKRVDLCCGLKRLPQELFALADTLEVLNLTGNQLESLPDELPRLRHLKVIFCSDNRFTRLPEVLGACPSVEFVGFKANQIREVSAAALPPSTRALVLTDNALQSLPATLGTLPKLQKLMLAGNQLEALPDSLAQAEHLELLRISANQLQQIPDWLLQLPKLAWLALAGNPLGWELPALPAIPRQAWASLVLEQPLGSGASRQVYQVASVEELGRASRTPPSSARALKLFKGTVTSDGRPEDELAASLAAGHHPWLCTPEAVLTEHPGGTSGLLLPLIPAGYVPLAGPPSLESCTRDIYNPRQTIGNAALVHLAAGLADAVAHLHRTGILHGDLYAHNVLWRAQTGAALLSDFGAATRLPNHHPAVAGRFKPLDTLAFGHLLNELCKIAQAPEQLKTMSQLAQACTDTRPQHRPTMQSVAELLHQDP